VPVFSDSSVTVATWPETAINSHVRTRNPTRAGHPLHPKTEGRWHARLQCRTPQADCGHLTSSVDSGRGGGLHDVELPPVIHFSTASSVHSYAEADQHVYIYRPQVYTQGANLGRPGAGVIGACSHAGPGYFERALSRGLPGCLMGASLIRPFCRPSSTRRGPWSHSTTSAWVHLATIGGATAGRR
jgi:hypothetical protein